MLREISFKATRLLLFRRVIIVHRVGHLAIGETAVWIGAESPHRDAAFAACRYAIEEIKKRVPIWKKEERGDGSTRWMGGCEEIHGKVCQ